MRIKQITVNLLLLLTTTLVLVLFIEYGLTFYLLKTSTSEYRFSFQLLEDDSTGTLYKPKPNSTITFAGIQRKINNRGFVRQGDIVAEPGSTTLRIVTYGDSVTFGVMVKNDQTYTALLEKQLNGSGTGAYEVLNGGGRGNSPFQYAAHIKHDLVEFHPDLVIIQLEVLNDTSDDMMFSNVRWSAEGLPQSWTGGRYKLGLFHSSANFLSNIGWGAWALPGASPLPGNRFGAIAQRTLIYTSISRLVGTSLSQSQPPPDRFNGHAYYYYNLGFDKFLITPDRIKAGFERMLTLIQAIHTYCQNRQVDFLLLLTPSQYIYQQSEYRTHSTRALAMAEERAAALGIPYLNVKEAIGSAGGDRLFFDFCHFTAEGNKIVADALFQQLAKKMDQP